MSISRYHQGLCLVTGGSGTVPEGGEEKEERIVQLNRNTIIKSAEV